MFRSLSDCVKFLDVNLLFWHWAVKKIFTAVKNVLCQDNSKTLWSLNVISKLTRNSPQPGCKRWHLLRFQRSLMDSTSRQSMFEMLLGFARFTVVCLQHSILLWI